MSSFGKERDLEIAAVVDFIKAHKDIRSVLDVGAHNTYSTYAQTIKDLTKQYCGVDIVSDPKTAEILDKYFVGNVTDAKLKVPTADLVFSISSIEHSGISTYHTDAPIGYERIQVFKRMYDLADRYLIITCPFGREMLIDGQYGNITHEDLTAFSKNIGKPIYDNTEFFYRPTADSDFVRIEYDEARNVEFDPTIGVPRCIAIIKIEKG